MGVQILIFFAKKSNFDPPHPRGGVGGPNFFHLILSFDDTRMAAKFHFDQVKTVEKVLLGYSVALS